VLAGKTQKGAWVYGGACACATIQDGNNSSNMSRVFAKCICYRFPMSESNADYEKEVASYDVHTLENVIKSMDQGRFPDRYAIAKESLARKLAFPEAHPKLRPFRPLSRMSR
jgi:hypothetical protein